MLESQDIAHLVGIVGGMRVWTFTSLLILAIFELLHKDTWYEVLPDWLVSRIVRREEWTIHLSDADRLPLILGSIGSVVLGFGTYVSSGLLVLAATFVSVLFFGVSPPTQEWLYLSAGLAVIVTVSFQSILTAKVQRSPLYRGWY